MAKPASNFSRRLARKIAGALFAGALTLVAYGLWLYGRDNVSFEDLRERQTAAMNAERATLTISLVELIEKQRAATAGLGEQQQREQQADKVLASLHGLNPGALDRVFGDREQQKINAERITRMEKLKLETHTRSVELQREIVIGEQKRGSLASRMETLDGQLLELSAEPHPVIHYARTTWHEARGWVMLAVAAYLFGGLLVAMLLYSGWARIVARSPVFQLTAQPGAPLATIGASAVTVHDDLWPGEVLRVKPSFLQSNDEGLLRKKRRVWSWRFPLSFYAAGLTGLVELRNARSGGERRVTFSNVHDAYAELVGVAVPEGGSLVVQARVVQGIITRGDQVPVIRRHWRLFCWQSWVAGQLGYFEFDGPCRLVVSCVSALVVESVECSDDKKLPARRVQSKGIVGFSPGLTLKAVRTDGFWRYARGMVPLFETKLSGSGVFLVRETDDRSRLRRRDGWRAGCLRYFGV